MQLIAQIELTTILMVMAACFVASVLSGVSGFGTGLVVAMVITPIIGPEAVVPALSVLMLINNFSRMMFYWRGLDWKVFGLIVATAAPSSVLGARIYVELDAEVIRVLLGAALIVSIPLRRWMARRQVKVGPKSLLSFGFAFGLATSVTVGAGVLMVPILLGAGLFGAGLLATDAAIAVVVHIVKIIAFSQLDALDVPLFVAAVAMGLCTMPGTWLASWIVRRTSFQIHTYLMEAVVMVGGVVILLGLSN